MRFTPLVSLVCLAFACLASAQTTSDEQVVRNGYPSELIQDFYEFGDPAQSPPDWMYDFERADLDGSGNADYIVAAYANSRAGRIRVYKPSSGPAPLAESTLREIGGTTPELTLRDLDGDRKPEIIAEYRRMLGTAAWIYKWMPGNELALFGPTTTDSFGQQHTVLGSPLFEDLDGDGRPEIVVMPIRHAEDPALIVYTLGGGGTYVKSEPRLFYAVYKRQAGEPQDFEDEMRTTKPGAYVLRIVNGDEQGNNAITSAEVLVNGKTIFGPNHFKQKTRVLSAPITLGETSTLFVSISGKPGTQMTVSVERAR